MTTSTDASGSGIASMWPRRNSTFGTPAALAPGELEHLVGHVEPDRAPARADPAGGDQHVGARSRAEVEHRLALVEVGDRGGNAAAERRLQGVVRRARGLVAVQRVAEDLVAVGVVQAGGVGCAAAAATARGSGAGRRRVALPHDVADVRSGQLSHACSASNPIVLRK